MPCVDPQLDDIEACASDLAVKTGYGDIVSFIPRSWLASMPVLPALASNTTNEAYATATGTFTAKTGKKFMKMETLNEFTETPGESVGSTGNLAMKYSPKFRIQNSVANNGLLEKILNIPGIVVVQKPGGGPKIIYGDLDSPVRIMQVAETGTATENFIELTFSAPTMRKAYFTGTIPYTPAV